ncbi:MAG: hypothetical protein LC104_14115 [Bacteroidales bacterium]|nr:hypothetical protein [Bacteroidales bacterium]
MSQLQQPHCAQTHDEMRRQSLVLILHDTATLDFTSHTTLDETGSIGNGHGRGFLQHNALAVIPHPRQVLGLTDQQIVARTECPQSETDAEYRNRDKPPGTRRLWIGYQRLQDLVLGHQIRLRNHGEDVGNR